MCICAQPQFRLFTLMVVVLSIGKCCMSTLLNLYRFEHNLTYTLSLAMDCSRQTTCLHVVFSLSPLPSFSSCTWSLLNIFLSPDPFARYSCDTVFFCGLVVSTVVRYCHHFFSVCVQASIFFLVAESMDLHCVPKKWPQNSNHYNYGISYQN